MNPPKKPSELPLQSFNPALIELLLKGGREQIIYHTLAKPPSPDDPPSPDFDAEIRGFFYFRKRLHSLRKRLRDAGDIRSDTLYKCEIKIDAAAGTMTLQPRDQRFDRFIREAGVGIPELGEDFMLDNPEE